MADVSREAGTAEGEQAAYAMGIEAVKYGGLDSALTNLGSFTNSIAIREKKRVGGSGESIAYLMQTVRLGAADLWARRWLSKMFMWRDPAIGLRLADSVVREEPARHGSHYYLAASLYNTHQYKAAEHHYGYAAEDPEFRLVALREVAEMWLTSRNVSNEVAVARGAPHLAVLEQEYPKEGRAAFLRLIQEERRRGRVQVESMRKALAGHDISDKWQAQRAASLRKTLDAAPEGVR